LDCTGFPSTLPAARGEKAQHQAAYEESDGQHSSGLGQEGGCSPASEDGPGDASSASKCTCQALSFGGLHQNRYDKCDADYHVQHGQDYYQRHLLITRLISSSFDYFINMISL
jgi:hypothetical protein